MSLNFIHDKQTKNKPATFTDILTLFFVLMHMELKKSWKKFSEIISIVRENNREWEWSPQYFHLLLTESRSDWWVTRLLHRSQKDSCNFIRCRPFKPSTHQLPYQLCPRRIHKSQEPYGCLPWLSKKLNRTNFPPPLFSPKIPRGASSWDHREAGFVVVPQAGTTLLLCSHQKIRSLQTAHKHVAISSSAHTNTETSLLANIYFETPTTRFQPLPFSPLFAAAKLARGV